MAESAENCFLFDSEVLAGEGLLQPADNFAVDLSTISSGAKPLLKYTKRGIHAAPVADAGTRSVASTGAGSSQFEHCNCVM